MDSTGTDIFRVFVESGKLHIVLALWLIGLVALFALVFFVARRQGWMRRVQDFQIDETVIGIGESFIKFKPNLEDYQIAYKLWVELSTRKIGLKIDFEHDVISEIYDSWYDFFRITREMIKEIPVSKVRKNESTREIVRISTQVLNEGLRPHLTTWQARFRSWYQKELEEDAEKEMRFPQDIQKEFPDYERLVQDMEKVNIRLIGYRKTLKGLWTAGVKGGKIKRLLHKRDEETNK